MRARIYQKAKTAMQSGRASTAEWVLEFPRHDRATPDRLMGWQSSGDTLRTVHLKFPSLDDAIAYAETNGIDHIVIRQGRRRRSLRAYADNFAPGRRQAWTH
ncbi:MAG: ETC complex I subunit [Candidatus Puniceispirillales bacterium]